jgi:hypothetical protein
VSATEGGERADRAGPALEGLGADRRARACVREALSVILAVRSESDGGDQTRGKQTAAGGAAPLHGGEVAGVEAGAS